MSVLKGAKEPTTKAASKNKKSDNVASIDDNNAKQAS
jgi:hypothetical protein